MKDPFEAAACEERESPPDSPIPVDDEAPQSTADGIVDEDDELPHAPRQQQQQAEKGAAEAAAAAASKGKKEEEDMEGEEEEENVSNVVGDSKFRSSAGPEKMSKMHRAILAQFTEEQMSRYESFRRSGFQKSNMRRLLTSITGSQKISMPMTIVVSGIAKMFVGELVETGRMVMMARKESGPIRPCHIREAYRRLKLEGKIPRRSVPRLFR